jgi:hypothetical protein
MAKKRRNKQAETKNKPSFPTVSDPSAALQWWRDRLRAGFPADGAENNLRELSGRVDEPEIKALFDGILNAAGNLISPDAELKYAPLAVNRVVLSDDRTRAFVSSATGGISCHSLPDGKKRWSVPAERAYQVGDMAVAGEMLVYTDAWNGKIIAIETSGGSDLWSVAQGPDGSPLLSPAGVAVLDDSRLVVSDSGSHRMVTFDMHGKPIDTVGVRGLLDEEITHINTAPRGTELIPYFEYPRSISVAADIDRATSLFVWDSGNGRLMVLGTSLQRKRTIRLAPSGEVKTRLAGQVAVVSGPSGPVVLVIDDAACTMTLRSPYGDLLMTVDLSQFKTGGTLALETFRMESGAEGNRDLVLVSSSGRTFKLSRDIFDTRSIAAALLPAFPEDCSLVLAAVDESTAAGSWRELSPTLDHSSLVRCLLGNTDLLTGELSIVASRIRQLAATLENNSLASDSSALIKALESQLEEIRNRCIGELERLSNPTPGTVESWSDALCEVDMEVFQTSGRSSSAELTQDHLLEEIRDLRPSIRRCGWRLRELHILLAKSVDIYLPHLLEMLSRLLDRRLELLAAVAGKLEYDRDPQRVNRSELQTAHAARLQVSAIDGAAVELTGELARLGENTTAMKDGELASKLATCCEKSSGLACHAILAELSGGESKVPALPAVPALNGSASDTLTGMVERMNEYLIQVQGGENGSQFGKVIDRQKKLFSVKASVLANFHVVNGSGQQVLERARSISGDAWDENRNLRPAVVQLEDKI